MHEACLFCIYSDSPCQEKLEAIEKCVGICSLVCMYALVRLKDNIQVKTCRI